MEGTHGLRRGHSGRRTQTGRLPPVSPPSPAGPERSGGPRRAQPGGVEGGERGDTIDRPADGGSEGLDACSLARRRGVGTLPRYVLSRRACSRGRGVRFILHADGRVVYCRINRARVPVAKACAGASARDLSLSVHAAGRAADRQHHRACGVDRTPPRPSSRCTETHIEDSQHQCTPAAGGLSPGPSL